jgi:ribonuclease D
MNSTLIDTQEQLEEICAQLSGSAYIALDTEFMRETTYFPKLALIQIADDAGQVHCIDPLLIRDFSSLQEILFNPGILKVVHSARQDLEIFYHMFDSIPDPIFDTQIASAILGYGEQISYANLVSTELGVTLDKSHTRTNWMQRPLSNEQISYAINDVKYLAQIYPLQDEKLKSLQRSHWISDEISRLTDINNYRVNPQGCWKKVKGANRLKGKQLAILQKIAALREEIAINEDIPRKRVITDDNLIDIARMAPDSLQRLQGIRSLHSKFIQRHGDRLLEVVAQCRKLPASEWPTLPKPTPLTDEQKHKADIMMDILRICADEHNIAATILGNKKDIERMARGEQESPLLNGWRNECCGKTLTDFAAGKIAIQMIGDKLTLLST